MRQISTLLVQWDLLTEKYRMSPNLSLILFLKAISNFKIPDLWRRKKKNGIEDLNNTMACINENRLIIKEQNMGVEK